MRIARAAALPDPAEFPEAPEVARRGQVPSPDGVGHIADVQIAARVDGDSVGSDELARPLPFLGITEARLHLTFQVVDAHAMTEAWRVVHSAHTVQLADEEIAFLVQRDAVGSMDVVPHGDELAVGVEDLDAMGLAIGDVHE